MRTIIRWLLTTLALAQLLLAATHAIRIGHAIRWGIATVTKIPEPSPLVHRALPESLGKRFTLTPGFVEGYIQARWGESVRISTFYLRERYRWRLAAKCKAGEIVVDNLDLSDACVEFLRAYYEKTHKQ